MGSEVQPAARVPAVSHATGELFVRLRARIWPMQQWVIDAQLVPRLRELFEREGVEIPADRIVTLYHFPPAGVRTT